MQIKLQKHPESLDLSLDLIIANLMNRATRSKGSQVQSPDHITNRNIIKTDQSVRNLVLSQDRTVGNLTKMDRSVKSQVQNPVQSTKSKLTKNKLIN